MRQKFTSRKSIRGFTLIEVIIVVSILGILAAIVVPKFSDASELAKHSALKEDLRNLRTQIELYKTQHNTVCPGYPDGNTSAAATGQTFIDQLTKFTDMKGKVSDTRSNSYPYGPYLGTMPTNAVNGSNAIKIVDTFPDSPSGDEGWVYQPSTGRVAANVDGVDTKNKAFFDY